MKGRILHRLVFFLLFVMFPLIPCGFAAYDQDQAVLLAREIVQEKNAEYVKNSDELVERLIDEGYTLWSDAKFAQAGEKFRHALRLRPNDERIKRMIYDVNSLRLAAEQRDAERQRQMIQEMYKLETERAWNIEEPGTTTDVSAQRKRAIINKLQELAEKQLVSLDFNNAEVGQVLQYLAESSGINILMDESVVNQAGTLTVQLKNVTLLKALEAVVRNKGLGYRFEDDFIWVSSRSAMQNEGMETRFYKLSQGLATFTQFATFNTVTVKGIRSDSGAVSSGSEEASGGGGAPTSETDSGNAPGSEPATVGVGTYEGVKIGGAGGVSGQVTSTIKDILQQLVEWPQGSRIFLDNRTSTLIVRNTPSNHAEIERLLEVLDVNPPQVMIEARFVEIGAEDLFDLGVKVNGKITGTGAVRGHTFPFDKNDDNKYVSPMDTAPATDPTIVDVDTGRYTPRVPYDFSLGTLDFSEFQAVLSAIDRKTTSNVLSSPKITTISGQEAVIKIVQEFRYPTKYNLETSSVTANGVTSTVALPFPDEFATRDIGIILKVVPNVGADGKTINLTLVPEVSEFERFEDYGSEGTSYKQPFFNVRSATASIVLNNSDTVVLGGLMREVVEESKDSVPVLGKIPLLGALFRSTYENKQKRNLLIFITAHIIAPSGEKTLSPASVN